MPKIPKSELFKAGAKTARLCQRNSAGLTVKWETFILTFGWFQQKKKLTAEQQAEVEAGYRSVVA